MWPKIGSYKNNEKRCFDGIEISSVKMIISRIPNAMLNIYEITRKSNSNFQSFGSAMLTISLAGKTKNGIREHAPHRFEYFHF